MSMGVLKEFYTFRCSGITMDTLSLKGYPYSFINNHNITHQVLQIETALYTIMLLLSTISD
tara:strand:- start:3225 stop:3407 length:183 start_codon:yes stop_codon:yes gene_type:complete